MGEYSQYQSGDTNTTKLEWQDLYASITLNYEVFVARMDDIDSYPYSLLLYVGPAFFQGGWQAENSNAKL